MENKDKQHYIPAPMSSNCPNWEVWHRFKELHPNSPETRPIWTIENMDRWAYHIREAEKNAGFKKVEREMSDIEKIRAVRRVTKWGEFSPIQKEYYEALARLFQNTQVYACGSQVRGDWMDDETDQYILSAREKAGMRVDRYSDYDFWVEPAIAAKGTLYCHFDRYRGRFNLTEMVAIPIYNPDV